MGIEVLVHFADELLESHAGVCLGQRAGEIRAGNSDLDVLSARVRVKGGVIAILDRGIVLAVIGLGVVLAVVGLGIVVLASLSSVNVELSAAGEACAGPASPVSRPPASSRQPPRAEGRFRWQICWLLSA